VQTLDLHWDSAAVDPLSSFLGRSTYSSLLKLCSNFE
jgi:hypothetical protein